MTEIGGHFVFDLAALEFALVAILLRFSDGDASEMSNFGSW